MSRGANDVRWTRLPPRLALVAAALLSAAQAAAQITDAVSREVSVYNDLDPPVEIDDAVSREVSFYNDLTPPVEIDDAVSREISFYNDLAPPAEIDDAISRELSVFFVNPCDTNCDGSVNGFDIDALATLLSGASEECFRDVGDANGDGSVNGFDIEPFIACMSGV